MRKHLVLVLAAAAVSALLGGGLAATTAATGSASSPKRASAPPGLDGFPAISCEDGHVVGNSPIKHVIYLQFDNVHFQRNLSTVPSDLEQMPHLLNFIRAMERCSRTITPS
jgi:hypothetical protein